jgi:hypothetical protein
MHHARIFMIGLAGVARLDQLELGDVLGADQGGLVTETAGGLEELALVAAGGLGADGEAVQSGFTGQPSEATQKGFDRAGSVRNLVFDAAGGRPGWRLGAVLSKERERALGDVETADETGRGVDRGSRMFDLEHKGLSEAVTRNVGLISVARPLLLCLLGIKVRCD